MRNRRTARAAAALMIVALVSAVAPASQAVHGTGPQCASGYSCLWRDSNWHTDSDVSKKISFQYYIPNLGLHSYGGIGNGANSATSLTNNGNYERAYYYNDTGCSNLQFSLAINTGDAALNDARAGANDNLEATAFDSYRGSC